MKLIVPLIISFVCFNIVSCSNKPGYRIQITIEKENMATEDDISLITDYLKLTTYDMIMNEGKDNWKVESYKIKLPEENFKHIEHQYIMFALEYYYDKQSTKDPKMLEKIILRFGNNWEGRNPILKNEIDRISDYIENKLSERFTDVNYSIEKRYVSPM